MVVSGISDRARHSKFPRLEILNCVSFHPPRQTLAAQKKYSTKKPMSNKLLLAATNNVPTELKLQWAAPVHGSALSVRES